MDFNTRNNYASRLAVLVALLLLSLPGVAQHEEEASEHAGTKWRIGLAMINSHVPAIEDSKQRAIIPTWGLDVDYKLSHRWVLGFILDVELQSYRVNYGDVTELEREFPVTAGLALIYEINRNVSFGVGYAHEFETHESFDIVFVQGMYTFRLPKNYDISPGLVYNGRLNAFDTYSFNLAVGKSF